ncbi:MAG: formylglycine-generating enzyme family protein, partial [Phycisphaeraceae bacterium]
QNARVTDYRWQGPTYWPWDRDMFPVDSRPHLRLQLNAKPVAFTAAGEEAELPRLTVRVRDDGEVREVQAQAATAEQAAPEPVQLERTGDRTAINPKDDAELVFVPAGEFIRGSDEGGPEERPQRDIHLDGYWVYKTPVTVGQYRAFAEATGRKFDPNFTSFPYQAVDLEGDGDNLPVITNWYDAQAYAEWVGGTLPSEAQWEKAARGTDGRTYPWGETWDASRVARDDWDQRKLAIGTHPVGSAPDGASPYGALDMAGNTWEWVGDWYAHDYYERSPGKNPKGPAAGAFRVVRGGDVHSPPMTHRSNFRMPVPPHAGNWVPIGFRVAIPADADGKPRE